jgi:hypothetical protein
MRRLWSVVALCVCLAGSASAATVTLAWDAPTTNTDASPLTNLDRYTLNRCVGSGCTPSWLLDVSGLVLTYQDTTITIGTIYRYLILAINSHGLESAISNIIEIGPPPAPTGVTAE